jgi:hypothetical protein
MDGRGERSGSDPAQLSALPRPLAFVETQEHFPVYVCSVHGWFLNGRLQSISNQPDLPH